MKYSILITPSAEHDIVEAADNIEFTLFNPAAADDLLDKTEEAINKLSSMPEKHALVDDPVLASWGIRMIVIENYLAFYVIDEGNKTVSIVRFLYGKRNWLSILRRDLDS